MCEVINIYSAFSLKLVSLYFYQVSDYPVLAFTQHTQQCVSVTSIQLYSLLSLTIFLDLSVLTIENYN